VPDTKLDARGHPYIRTTVRIYGDLQIETFEAMCAVLARRPHQLAADMVLDGIRKGRRDKNIQSVVASIRGRRRETARRGLRLIRGGDGRSATAQEACTSSTPAGERESGQSGIARPGRPSGTSWQR
jgi:hypothetical protein